MKKFYLDGEPIKVEISPTLVETLDESLDNMTITLIVNFDPTPIEPDLHIVQVKNEENDEEELINEFVISADNVELATQNPLRYKHVVSLVQTSQLQTKHIIRNTVFSTTLESNLFKLYVAKTCYLATTFLPSYQKPTFGPYSYANEIYTDGTIDLDRKSIKEMVAKINFNFQIPKTGNRHVDGLTIYYDFNSDYLEPEHWSDGFENLNDDAFKQNLPTIIFSISDNGQTYTYNWSIADSYINNKTIELSPGLKQFLNDHTSGTLTISIGEIAKSTNWESTDILENEMPLLVNFSVEFFVKSVDTSVYEVIDILLKQQMKETNDYNSTYDSKIKPLFKLPDANHNPDLYNLLINTNAPNFIFTQSTMFDALAEIFKLFDATFRIDEDGYLDIEYFNDESQTKIELSNSSLVGKASSLGEQRFTNRLVTYFQNTKINDRFPNSNTENATAFIRSKSYGVPKEDDFVFETPKPIDILKKVEIKCSIGLKTFYLSYYEQTEPPTGVVAITRGIWGDIPNNDLIDITDNVFEESIWSMLNEGIIARPTGYTKSNCLYYTRGTPYIYISAYYEDYTDRRQYVLENAVKSALYKKYGIVTQSSPFNTLFDLNIPDWHDVKLAVSYIALVDGKLVNESLDKKYDGETLINQSNGSIDINKLGLNMVGLSLKLGQPTLSLTQKFTSWDNRIKKGQYFIDGNGDRWVANTCSYTLITAEIIQANIEFVKNFNSLATRIELNREKRLSNISNELTVKCEETYGEFVYYSAKPMTDSNEKIVFDPTFLANQICMTFGAYKNNTDVVEYALITAIDKNGNIISLEESGEIKNIAIPMVVYGSGNSVCFEMSFEHPMSAGNQLLENYDSIWENGGWFSKAVLYTDETGYAEKFTIDFVKMNEELTREFPAMKNGSNYLSFTSLGKINKLAYYKKPNEIFALNYQLHFMPVEKMRDFLNNEWIKNNAFANGLNGKTLKIKASSSEDYSILDIKAEGVDCIIAAIDPTVSVSGWGGLDLKIVFTASITAENWNAVKSWAVCDEEDNIYFATNTAPSEDETLTAGRFAIYFKSRHHRI